MEYSWLMRLRRIVGSSLAALLLVMMTLPEMCAACARVKTEPGCVESHGAGSASHAHAAMTPEMAATGTTESVKLSCENCGNHEQVIKASLRHAAPEQETRLANCGGVSCLQTAERMVTVERNQIQRRCDPQILELVISSGITGSFTATKDLSAGWSSRKGPVENFTTGFNQPLSVSLKI